MNKKYWYYSSGPKSDVVVSTRIRLARNLKQFPFPGHMDSQQQRSVLQGVSAPLVTAAGGSEFKLTELTSATVSDVSLVEHHLISPELLNSNSVRGVVLNEDKSISVMINEEDHVRIQAMGAGFCPEECLKNALRVDTLLDSSLTYAFDANLGFLTHCPTNLGTGLRASAMLHLPALTETGAIKNIIEETGKIGFTVRGIYGEGSSATGALYQISNQVTLGLSEHELVNQLSDIVNEIIPMEQNLRRQLLENDPAHIKDRIWRAKSILSNAWVISSDEAMKLLSDLRMGIALNEITTVDYETVNRLFTQVQPASISHEKALSNKQRDIARAELLRNTL